MSETYAGRLGVQQRVLPNYRVPFFDMLAGACEGGLGLFAGMPRPVEGITPGELHVGRHFAADNVHLLAGPLYACYQRGLTAWLEEWNPDALIMEANPRYLASGPAVRWMHARGRRVVGWGLGAPTGPGPLVTVRRGNWRRFVGQFDALIAYSGRGAQQYADLGYPRERIVVAPNAVAPRSQAAPAVRPEHVERPLVLFVGRLQARKRVDALIRACGQMIEPWPRLLIVGDGPERAALQALAKEVFPSAEFAGARQGDELARYFEQADLFVLPGTGGLAIQEAMAHGLPVIVAQGDGTQDDLVRAGNGWLIPPGDDRALLETLHTALSDIPRLRQMGAESFRIVREEVNLEHMVEVFVRAVKGT